MVVATYSVSPLVVNGKNGHGHDDCVLAKCQQLGCDLIGFYKKQGDLVGPFFLLPFAVGGRDSKPRNDCMGLAVKKSICCNSQYTHQLADERLMSERFEVTGESGPVNFVVTYAQIETDPNTKLKTVFLKNMGHLVKEISTMEGLFVLTDANARTGTKMGRGHVDDKALGAFGRDKLNDIGEHLLTFVLDKKLTLTNMVFSPREGGVSHTCDGISSRNDPKRIDCILNANSTDTAYMMLRSTPSPDLSQSRFRP